MTSPFLVRGTLAALASVSLATVVACGDSADPDLDPTSPDAGSNTSGGADAAPRPTTDASSDAASSADGRADAAPAQTYTLTATVVGLQGQGLVLTDAKGGDLAVAPQAGSQKATFGVRLAAGTAYDVSVKTQPSGPTQRCEVTGGKGTVVAGNVESITVNCTTAYAIGGTVSGLAGKNLVLQNNAGDDLTLNANGQFSFATPLDDGSAYAVTVKTQPTDKWQTCTVGVAGADAGAARGTLAGANVTNLEVKCTTNRYKVGLAVTGLDGAGLVFQNNAADDLAFAANGTQYFTTELESGADYAVTVATQPSAKSQDCVVAAPAAKVLGADVLLNATCTTKRFKVGGTLAGLAGTVVLQNNAGDDLTLTAANVGAFQFGTSVASGSPYAVTVKTQPANGERCTVGGPTGTVTSADIASVTVTCGKAKLFYTSSNGITGFYGYDVNGNTWATLASPPSTTHSQLTTDGSATYLLGSDGTTYEYKSSTNAWSVKTAVNPGTAGSPIGFFKWTPKGFYYVNDGTTLLRFLPTNGAAWQSFTLPANASSAGSVGPDGNLYLREFSTGNVLVWNTETNVAVRRAVMTPAVSVGENSRFGSFLGGKFYVREFSGSLRAVDPVTGAATDTGRTPTTSHASSDVGNGLLYIGGYAGVTAFQAYDPATNALTTLAPSPNVSNHSTLVFVASPN